MNIFLYIRDRWFRGRGVTPQPADHRDFLYKDYFTGSSELPLFVDNSSSKDYVRDQKDSNACVGFGIADCLQSYLRKIHSNIILSPLFIWFHAKKYHGYELENKGVYIRNGLKAMMKQGICYEGKMPFKIGNYLYPPSLRATSQAKDFLTLWIKNKISYYFVDFISLKQALADGHTVVMGLWLNNSFYGNTTGVIKDVSNNGNGHLVRVVGYDDDTGMVKAKNDWGRSWGDKGYCYIPYTYLVDNSYDSAVIREKSNGGAK